jgi:hypothetical protein
MEGYKRYIKWKPSSQSAQIHQIYSKGLEFALVSENDEQCHNFVWCKDFLHDIIYATLNNRAIDIYQFKYNPEYQPKPCLSKIRLLIANSKEKRLFKKIPACIDFLNQFEDTLNIKKTIVRECWKPPEQYTGVFLFEGSKRWLQAPPMLSLYSLLIRVGFVHTIGNSFAETIQGVKEGEIKPYQKYDKTWLNGIDLALDKLFKYGDRRIFSRNIRENYPSNIDIEQIHNYLGIIGFSSDIMTINWKDIRPLVPYWHTLK